MVQKCSFFVNIHKVENLKGRGVGGQKSRNLVNVVCEQPLNHSIKKIYTAPVFYFKPEIIYCQINYMMEILF